MRKVAVLGGTFNPIHNGHLFMADSYNNQFDNDLTIFIPTNLPPHKSSHLLASNEDRLNMCELAVLNRKNYIVSDIEYKIGSKSYTVNTLYHLLDCYKNCKLTFIMGADMLMSFDKWYKTKEILEMTDIAVLPRHGIQYNSLLKQKDMILSLYGCGKINILDTEMLDISSTDIRNRVMSGESITDLVPQQVSKYIKNRGIYTDEYRTEARKL